MFTSIYNLTFIIYLDIITVNKIINLLITAAHVLFISLKIKWANSSAFQAKKQMSKCKIKQKKYTSLKSFAPECIHRVV